MSDQVGNQNVGFLTTRLNYLLQKERLSVEAIKDLAIQICNAIIFIHLRGLVHCAITSHAVCVVNSNTFKLGNFEYMVEKYVN